MDGCLSLHLNWNNVNTDEVTEQIELKTPSIEPDLQHFEGAALGFRVQSKLYYYYYLLFTPRVGVLILSSSAARDALEQCRKGDLYFLVFE